MADVSEGDVKRVLEKDENSFGKYESYEVLSLSDKPVGFLADHFVLRVTFSSPSRVKDYFLKAVPKNVEKRAEYLDETGFFSKEVRVYQHLIPKLKALSSLSWAPECYHAKEGSFIIMEILQDYTIKSSQSLVFDFEHLKVSSAALAVFHASSLIYEAKYGRNLKEEYSEMLEENAYPQTAGHVRQKGLENAIEVLMELVKLIPSYRDSTQLKLILSEFPATIRKIYKFAETSKKYKNVASHGDLWVNNFMFKYENERPVACKLIDFQLARYAPPAFDLAQLVYINTTRATRAAHLDDVLNTYCDFMEIELKRAQVDVAVFPRTEILASFKEFHLAGLIESVVFGHLTLLPPSLSSTILSSSEEYDNFINQSRAKTCLEAFNLDYYRDRLTEVLSEIIEEFIIKDKNQ